MLRRCRLRTWHLVPALLAVVVYCEVLHYVVVLWSCDWPGPWPGNEPAPLKVMMIADTHLLGPRHGHWLDKLRREWQMHRAFVTAEGQLRPDIVFILGDLFDEGQWSDEAEFQRLQQRLHSLFPVANDRLVAVAGNHDLGFHYAIWPAVLERWQKEMRSESVRLLRLRGVQFVLLNSMALEGDGCRLCGTAERRLKDVNATLDCLKDREASFRCDFLLGDLRDSPDNLDGPQASLHYSRPFLLQHFPLHRPNDAQCQEPDQEMDPKQRLKKNRERWEVLSKDASRSLVSLLRPRAAFDGHTHAGCRVWHAEGGFWEWTLSSFSWRNRPNPALLLLTASPAHFNVHKCLLPDERTVIALYTAGAIATLIVFVVQLVGVLRERCCPPAGPASSKFDLFP